MKFAGRKVKWCLKSIKNMTMNYQCQETHVKVASQITHLKKNWPVPTHTKEKNEKNLKS